MLLVTKQFLMLEPKGPMEEKKYFNAITWEHFFLETKKKIYLIDFGDAFCPLIGKLPNKLLNFSR